MIKISIISNVCRVCLESNAIENLRTNSSLNQKFKVVAKTNIKENENLPQYLCKMCVARLNLSYDFIKQSEATENHLRSFISGFNAKVNNICPKNDPLTEQQQKDTLCKAGYQLEEILIESVKYIESEAEDSVHVTNEDSLNDADTDYQQDTNDLRNGTEKYASSKENSHQTKNVMNDEQKKSMHICSVCSKDFSTKSNLLRHEILHKDILQQFLCSICGKAYTQKGSLKCHMTTHSGKYRYICKLCNRGFSRSANFNAHLKIHTGEKPYKCTKCERSFRNKQALRKHVTSVHEAFSPATKIIFQCEICEKNFQSKFTYQTHMKKHTGRTLDLYNCELCDKIFNSKTSYLTHVSRKHSDGYMYPCIHCSQRFKKKSELIEHGIEHLVAYDGLIDCIYCDKQFTDRDIALSHIKTHQKEKCHECPECGKAFIIKENLERHMAVHEY